MQNLIEVIQDNIKQLTSQKVKHYHNGICTEAS